MQMYKNVPNYQKHLLDKFFAQPTHIIEGLVQWALLVHGHSKSDYYISGKWVVWEKNNTKNLLSDILSQAAVDQPLY